MVTNIRPIRTEDDYQAALARIDALMDAEAGSDEADELEVLTTLVELFEDAHYPINLPDPITAIKFRMEQEGISQSDLAPILGSRAKVSEVLSGKRELTLKMIRALNAYLGIPAEVLIQERGGVLPEEVDGVEWERFPLLDMAKRGWVERTKDLKDRAEEVMRDLIDRAGGLGALPQAMYRKTTGGRRNAKTNPYALQAWCLQVLADARSTELASSYAEGTVTIDFLRELAKLSVFNEGPRLAREYLNRYGIVLVIERHLPKTYLDGAAMRTIEGTPVIGMTLRYDRIDNFWFCLLHELAHVGRHMSGNGEELFVDDLSLRERDHADDDVKETEADTWAQDALIPPDLWEGHPASTHPTTSNVISLARQAGVHPAIVAGRVRYEHHNYRLLSQFVGSDEVRRHFLEETA
jgi:HTH-type transcriptional regulator/antitoxin HigA|tara:strand:- start:189 stop:1415 length:1227 start_codon:yes stop_codon:yes gene_type:complete